MLSTNEIFENSRLYRYNYYSSKRISKVEQKKRKHGICRHDSISEKSEVSPWQPLVQVNYSHVTYPQRNQALINYRGLGHRS